MRARYTAAFMLLGLSFVGLALVGGPPVPLLWGAVSFLVVAMAYALNRPVVFGKCTPWRPLATLALLPYHLLMHLSWRLATTDATAAFTQIEPGLWLGRWPRRGRLPPGVERIVDLTAEMPVPPDAGPIDYRCLPTLDRMAPGVAAATVLVDGLVEDPRPTLVHCAMGHGRSPVIIIAMLMRRGSSFDAALARIQRLRPRVHLTDEQAKAARKIGTPTR
jgi:protein-tyrosine phosphatase